LALLSAFTIFLFIINQKGIIMKTSLFTCLLLLCSFIAKAQDASQEIIKVGDIMPAFTIVSDNGKELKSAALKGKVILINFFATWCPPCQKELAEVQAKLWPMYKDNANFSLLVIGREHSDTDLSTYNEKKGFTFPLYPDKSRDIFNAFAKSQIPRTYLIGKDGKVIYTTIGFKEDDIEILMKKIQIALR